VQFLTLTLRQHTTIDGQFADGTVEAVAVFACPQAADPVNVACQMTTEFSQSTCATATTVRFPQLRGQTSPRTCRRVSEENVAPRRERLRPGAASVSGTVATSSFPDWSRHRQTFSPSASRPRSPRSQSCRPSRGTARSGAARAQAAHPRATAGHTARFITRLIPLHGAWGVCVMHTHHAVPRKPVQ